jgi:hypothetical protein
MTPRRLFICLLAVAFTALGRSARADDAQTAAAAMQGLGLGGAPGGGPPGGGPGGGPGAQGRKKKDESGFARPLTAPQFSKTSDGDPEHPPAKKKANAKTKSSKYTSRDLDEHGEHVYRFNADGEPLNSAPKKKAADAAAAKAKKKASTESDDAAEKNGDCSSDEPCAAKKSDSDAF